MHYGQMVRRGKLADWDYVWPWENYKAYGQLSPPEYDVSRVGTDVHLFWSESDWLADGRDVRDFLMKRLPAEHLVVSLGIRGPSNSNGEPDVQNPTRFRSVENGISGLPIERE